MLLAASMVGVLFVSNNYEPLNDRTEIIYKRIIKREAVDYEIYKRLWLPSASDVSALRAISLKNLIV